MAKPWWMRGIESNETDFLPPDVAFRVGARLEGGRVKVRWVIADGYYLYRSKMSVAAPKAPIWWSRGWHSAARASSRPTPISAPRRSYTQQVEGTVPYRRLDFGAHPLQIKVTYQGCAEAGLCYPLDHQGAVSRRRQCTAPPRGASYRWEGIAIGGGAFAFLLAGLVLRKGRTLPLPAA